MSFVGADVQQLRSLGAQLNNKASEIESILTTLTGALNSTQWVGNDATAFRNDWTGHHTAALKQVANALRDAGAKAQQNATQQEQTSA